MNREDRKNYRNRERLDPVRYWPVWHRIPTGIRERARDVAFGLHGHGRFARSNRVVDAEKQFIYRIVITSVSAAATVFGLAEFFTACLGK